MKEKASDDALTSNRICQTRCKWKGKVSTWNVTHAAFGDDVDRIHDVALLEYGFAGAIAFDANF